MDNNPYNPPQSNVVKVDTSSGVAPSLWNPQVAAAWSLLLTPGFGAYLHMKNWQALGEVERATASKRWFVAFLVVWGVTTALGPFFPDRTNTFVFQGFMVGWYFVSARSQAGYVRQRYGDSYEHRQWPRTILYGIVGVAAYVATLIVISLVLRTLARLYL